MVAPSVGKTGGLGDRNQSLQLARDWLLPEARGRLEAVVVTLGIRIEGGGVSAGLAVTLARGDGRRCGHCLPDLEYQIYDSLGKFRMARSCRLRRGCRYIISISSSDASSRSE